MVRLCEINVMISVTFSANQHIYYIKQIKCHREIFAKRGSYLENQRLVRGSPSWQMAMHFDTSPLNSSLTSATGRHPSTTCSSTREIISSVRKIITQNQRCIITCGKDWMSGTVIRSAVI